MFCLTGTSTVLRLRTSAAESTDFMVSVNDFSSSGNAKAASLGNIASAADTTILTAPGSGEVRVIEHVTIRNKGTGSNTVIVFIYDGADEYLISPDVPLSAGETYTYENGYGWKRIDSSGREVVVPITVTGGGGGSSVAWETVTDADFTAADDTGYDIQSGDLTGDHSVDVSGITTSCEFMNGQETYVLTFVGESVYMRGGAETIENVVMGGHTTLIRINGKLILY